jgi:hypothetical protein
VLPHHSITADEPPTAGFRELRRPLPCKIATRDCMQQFDSKQGRNCNVIDSYE